MTATRALVVEITRGDRVESRHEVDVAVVDVEGRLVRAHGHAARDVMPRSAAKPIQALPLLGTGAADAKVVRLGGDQRHTLRPQLRANQAP